MNKIDQLKNELKKEIAKKAKKILNTKQGKELKKLISNFECDCYMKGSYRHFDENGDFTSSLKLDSPIDFSELDDDLILEINAQATENSSLFLLIDKKSNEIELAQFLGEPVTVNFSDSKCYAIHSNELKLKIMAKDLIGDDDSEKLKHALYLIEYAMREHGTYPSIVELDYYGGVLKELGTGLGFLEGEEFEVYGQNFEVLT